MANSELLWLENLSFAAWGCGACGWIALNPGHKLSGKASSTTQAAFDKHDCKKFPRHTVARERRPSAVLDSENVRAIRLARNSRPILPNRQFAKLCSFEQTAVDESSENLRKSDGWI